MGFTQPPIPILPTCFKCQGILFECILCLTSQLTFTTSCFHSEGRVPMCPSEVFFPVTNGYLGRTTWTKSTLRELQPAAMTAKSLVSDHSHSGAVMSFLLPERQPIVFIANSRLIGADAINYGYQLQQESKCYRGVLSLLRPIRYAKLQTWKTCLLLVQKERSFKRVQIFNNLASCRHLWMCVSETAHQCSQARMW